MGSSGTAARLPRLVTMTIERNDQLELLAPVELRLELLAADGPKLLEREAPEKSGLERFLSTDRVTTDPKTHVR